MTNATLDQATYQGQIILTEDVHLDGYGTLPARQVLEVAITPDGRALAPLYTSTGFHLFTIPADAYAAALPDSCPTCGADLKGEGYPGCHQDAGTGWECTYVIPVEQLQAWEDPDA
ncbi:hypothetical protein AB0395_34770 [Streptosporangium sp. NPDC051023]|uniref:hypothetical protein n=1 Tax=Streptosporangium sp. NPDC051023 TaxID=3155410 RepID=UPI00344B5A4B